MIFDFLDIMTKKRKTATEDPSLMGFVTKPWFVLSVMIVCFGILTPKIFLPLFRQLLGLSKPVTRVNSDEFGPPDRSRLRPMASHPQAPVDSDRSTPNLGPRYGHHHGGGSGNRSFLSFLLPIYAVGIGLFMIYTLFKVHYLFKNQLINQSVFVNIRL